MIGAMITRIGSRKGWQAANRRDLAYLEPHVADDIVYEVAGRPPLGGRFVGKAAWREANQRWMDDLASFKFRVIHEALTHPFALGLSNVILTEYELMEKMADGRILRTRGIDVSEMRNGKLVAERNYLLDLDGETALHAPAPSDGTIAVATSEG